MSQLMKTMLKIGDYVRHLSTGDLGQVVAYGHEILDSVYHPTVQVEVASDAGINRRIFVEDLSSAWVLVEEEVEKEKTSNTLVDVH
jgi:hypothetical protein